MRPFTVTATGGADQGNGAGVSPLALVNYLSRAPSQVSIALSVSAAATGTISVLQTVGDMMPYLQGTGPLPPTFPALDDTGTPITAVAVGGLPKTIKLQGNITGLLVSASDAGVVASMTVLQAGK